MKKLAFIVLLCALPVGAQQGTYGPQPSPKQGSSAAVLPSVTASGQLRTTQDPTQLLLEDFGAALNTSIKWNSTAGGTGAACSSSTDAGGCTLTGGATLNGFSQLQSIPIFRPLEPGFVFLEMRNNLESPINTGSYEFFGLATTPASPTIANPVIDGCGFDVLQGTSKLMAVCWQGSGGTSGTRVVIQDLSAATGNSTQPTDASAHKYNLVFSGSEAYWLIDRRLVAQYQTGANGPNINALPITALVISNSGTQSVLSLNGISLSDTSRRESNVCDPINGWLCATVDSSGRINVVVADAVGTTDPCQSPAAQKSFAVINITSATTTSLVAVSGTTTVYVCGFSVTLASTVSADTIQFEYGTGAACTSPTVMTGAFNTNGALTGAQLSYGGGGQTIFKSAASNGVCALTTVGTGPSIQGVMTYVQQ